MPIILQSNQWAFNKALQMNNVRFLIENFTNYFFTKAKGGMRGYRANFQLLHALKFGLHFLSIVHISTEEIQFFITKTN